MVGPSFALALELGKDACQGRASAFVPAGRPPDEGGQGASLLEGRRVQDAAKRTPNRVILGPISGPGRDEARPYRASLGPGAWFTSNRRSFLAPRNSSEPNQSATSSRELYR